MLDSFAESHIGQRKINEDACLIDESIGLYIVADGVGGLEKGEIASRLACEVVQDCIISGQTLTESIYSAHRAIIKEVQRNSQKQGMATTIAAVLFNENAYEVAWVGDSRVYLWDNNLKLLTKDDSYVEMLHENGHISFDEMEKHPDRNIISQALGIQRKEIHISTNSGTLERGRVLLLCTDGLYSITNEENIVNELSHTNNVSKLTQQLVDIAVNKEGKDNISLIVIKSEVNTYDDMEVVEPKIVRVYDKERRKMVSNTIKTAAIDKFSQETPVVLTDDKIVDPELIDQTVLNDLSKEEIAELDKASRSKIVKSTHTNNYVVPITMAAFLLLFLIIILVLL